MIDGLFVVIQLLLTVLLVAHEICSPHNIFGLFTNRLWFVYMVAYKRYMIN